MISRDPALRRKIPFPFPSLLLLEAFWINPTYRCCLIVIFPSHLVFISPYLFFTRPLVFFLSFSRFHTRLTMSFIHGDNLWRMCAVDASHPMFHRYLTCITLLPFHYCLFSRRFPFLFPLPFVILLGRGDILGQTASTFSPFIGLSSLFAIVSSSTLRIL